MSYTGLHFSFHPDDALCGREPVRALCGDKHLNVTTWDVANVDCCRCLEVMEEKATGTTQVTIDPTSFYGHQITTHSTSLYEEMITAIKEEEKKRSASEILARVKKKNWV
jgi:hypothetical protein